MDIVARIVTGLLLVSHGLVHLLYLVPDVGEFSVDRSWLVPEAARRPLSATLIAATVGAFVLLALAVWGVPGLAHVWAAITVVAAVLSAVLLVLFWNTWLVFGLTIDAMLLAVAVIQPAWVQQLISGTR